jgi:death-on-curing protein
LTPQWLDGWLASLLHDWSLKEHGGAPGVQDRALLESALERAPNRLLYAETAPTLCDLAAAYAFAIARSAPFIDGNKRAAWMAARVFLSMNGIELEMPDRVAVVVTMMRLGDGRMTEAEFAAWLQHRTR